MISHFARPITYPIPEKLKNFVTYSIHGKSEEKLDLEYPMFATGFPLLIFVDHVPGIRTDGVLKIPESNLNIAGQIYGADVAVNFNKQYLDAVGIILSPTTPYYLFHSLAKPMLNKWTALEKISPIHIEELKSSLQNCSDIEEKLVCLYGFLEELANKRQDALEWLDDALHKILSHQGVIEIGQLYDEDEISGRHFRRKFQEIIGMPPKYYCKVIQITSVFQLLNNGESDNLTQVALNCGYFDQSHFIKAFKQHVGQSPNNFLNSEYSFLSNYLGAR